MNKIDTYQIKKMTNQLIGYENYKMEEEMKTKKMKKVILVFGVVFTLGIGTVTANALTDNKIVDIVKDMVSVKIISGNVKETKNGVCKKLENGNFSCTFNNPEDGEEITMEYSASDTNNPDISIQYEYIDK